MKKTVLLLMITSLIFGQTVAQKQKDADMIVSKYSSLFDWVIKPKYEFILSIPAINILTAKQNGKFGYITLEEDILVPFKYGYASEVSYNGYAFWGKSYGNWNYIIDVNKNGEQVIEGKYNYAGIFYDGYAVVENGWYAIDTTGKVVIPYNKGFLKRTGNLADIIEGRSKDLIPYQKINNMGGGKFGYVNKKAEWIIKPQYFSATPRTGDFYIIGKDLKNLGLLDLEGNQVLEPQYENIKGLSDKLIQVKKADKWGLLNMKMELVIPCEYDYICNFDEEGKAYFEKGNTYGYIYTDGLKITENGELDRKAIRYFIGAAYNDKLGIYAYEEKLLSSDMGICLFENDQCKIQTDAVFNFVALFNQNGKKYVLVGKKIGLSTYYGLYNEALELIVDPNEKEFGIIDLPNSSGYFRIGLKNKYGVAKFKE